MSALTQQSSPISDARELKKLIQQMNRAFRDSEGGGLMERFEDVSKLLFTKIVDEQGVARGDEEDPVVDVPSGLADNGQHSDQVIYERARAVWTRAIGAHPDVFSGARAKFPRDVRAVARIMRLLADIDLSQTSTDIKGGVYEEMLKNTFEKNENQQYFTPRIVVDFMVALTSPGPEMALCDPASGSGGFLVGALSSLHGLSSSAQEGFARSMRGAEVDERMAWIARINMLMHGGDPKVIRHLPGAGSLAPLETLMDDLPVGHFDLILTNPPFGSDLNDQDSLAELTTGSGRSSRRRGVLFLERCVELLRPNGSLAIVIDDSILNLPGNSDIRKYLRLNTIIEAVISLPDVTFMPYSTAKSSIVIARRKATDDEVQGLVLMADVEHVGIRPNGDPLYSDVIDPNGARQLQTDLPSVLNAWQSSERPEAGFMSDDGVTFMADINSYVDDHDGDRLDVYYYHPMRHDAEALLRTCKYPLVSLDSLVDFDTTSKIPAEEFGDLSVRWIGLGEIEPHTGRYEVRDMPGDRLKSTAHVFKAGDILISRLRPKLRKAILISEHDEGGLCSGELVVLRRKEDAAPEVDFEFLTYLLRSDFVFGQMIYRITGIGRPRVSAKTIRRLQVPLVPGHLQQEYARTLNEASHWMNTMRAEAYDLLERSSELVDDAYEDLMGELAFSD